MKMGSLGWALIQQDWCPCKKADKDTDTHRADRVKTQGRQPSAGHGERPPKEPTLPAP